MTAIRWVRSDDDWGLDQSLDLDDWENRSQDVNPGCIESVEDSMMVECILARLNQLTLAGSCSPQQQTMFLLTQTIGTKQVSIMYNVTQRWVQMTNQSIVEMLRRDLKLDD